MVATLQYREMASNQEAVRYTVTLLDMMIHWWELTYFTYDIVEDYYHTVFRKIDDSFSIRTVERKIRELAEQGYLIREKLGRTYRFVPTPAFFSLAASLDPAYQNHRAKGVHA